MKASHTVRRWHWLDWGGRKINTSLPLTREKTSRASTEEAHVDEAHAAQQRARCRTTARARDDHQRTDADRSWKLFSERRREPSAPTIDHDILFVVITTSSLS